MTDPQAETLAQLDALIAELVANSAALAKATAENAHVLGELLAERRQIAGAQSPAPEQAQSSHVAADVLEVAALHAEAAGVTVDEFLRAAVLAHGTRLGDSGRPADRELAARLRQARDAALRIHTRAAR
jgi:hypothetical protein